MQIFYKLVKNFYMDAILVAMLAAFSVGGAFKGFVKSFFSLFGFIIAVGLGLLITPHLAESLVDSEFLYQPILGFISNILNNLDPEFVTVTFSNIEEAQLFVEASAAPFYAKSLIKLLLAKVTFEGNVSIFDLVGWKLYVFLIKSLTFIVLVFVMYIMLKIIQFYIQKLIHFNFLKVTDRVLGFLLGCVLGIISYLALVSVIIMVGQFTMSEWIIEKIEAGSLSSIFYHSFSDKLISLF